MTHEMTPAMTAKEWAEPSYTMADTRLQVKRFDGDLGFRVFDKLGTFREKDRHALAALALYGQPFGFTREDVEVLRRVLREWTPLRESPIDLPVGLATLAARIEALLPPEAK